MSDTPITDRIEQMIRSAMNAETSDMANAYKWDAIKAVAELERALAKAETARDSAIDTSKAVLSYAGELVERANHARNCIDRFMVTWEQSGATKSGIEALEYSRYALIEAIELPGVLYEGFRRDAEYAEHLREVLSDAHDCLFDGNWDRIAVRHLVARIEDELRAIAPRVEKLQPNRADVLVDALRKIIEWKDFPECASGRSFGFEYGSNGERDHMRAVAEKALQDYAVAAPEEQKL